MRRPPQMFAIEEIIKIGFIAVVVILIAGYMRDK